jgi:hypothetical protein
MGLVGSLLKKITSLASKVFRNGSPNGHFSPPRMCPFCGLITPRKGRSCLECGKVLNPA